MKIKLLLRRLVPRWLLTIYHYLISYIVALVYLFPTHGLIVIGITGTKGKSTTAAMLWHILRSEGYKTALLSTAQISTGDTPTLNEWKMTMPGRTILQKFLCQARRNGCTHIVLEVSSEGLAQWRQAGIKFSVGVFTNLTPEHIEAHGNFAKYRAAKGKLFSHLRAHGGVAVINLDDTEAKYFIALSGDKVIGYTLQNIQMHNVSPIISAQMQITDSQKSVFKIDDEIIHLPVGAKFNIYNALAAIGAAQALTISISSVAQALASFAGTPGRLEYIRVGQNFDVVVDYAHTAESLEAVYELLQGEGKLIAVLGSCGGGRDKDKRVVFGRLAGVYADCVVVTNEDPYDEDPNSIMESVAAGARQAGKILNVDLFILDDRRVAIRQAFQLAHAGDTVVITGKGAEQWLCVAGGQKIKWDDRQVVRDELEKLT